MKHRELNRLLCAALVNTRFCQTLLRNPARAIAAGYSGHTFELTAEERDLVLGIRAPHLEAFAAQVHSWISGGGRESSGGELRWNPLGSAQPAMVRVPIPARS